MTFTRRELALLVVSLAGLYLLPHFCELIVPVGAGFAMALIGSSRPAFARRQLLTYASYIAISVGTYYILFQEQPWKFLFGWLPERSREFGGIPVSPCSIIMALAGWLLLSDRTNRRKYMLVTLAIQVPLAAIFNIDGVHSAFQTLGKFLRYTDEHAGAHQAWQFLWMLNYYLPIYWWSHHRSSY